jgi:phage terminase large subunit-like protein
MTSLPLESLRSLSRDEKRQLLRLLTEQERRRKRRKLWTLFPAEGPLRRELYPKHLEFFRLGATVEERCFMAANRVGKTVAGGSETTLHLTGRYPDWWEGRRFAKPVDWWAAGKTGETTRDIVQHELLGPVGEWGTGLIPGDDLVRVKPRSGIADAVDTIHVKHLSGGTSRLKFKSYDQGRQSFEGTKKDGIWCDEEPPFDVYGECVLRTAATVPGQAGGVIMLTFTPMLGLSETALYFAGELLGVDQAA